VIEIEHLTGPDEIRPFIPDIADLRMTVFREWPYLYDGSAEEEKTYLSHFANSPASVVGLARSDGKIVGATTAQPLSDTHSEFRAPFEAQNLPINEIFYFGESVLLRAFRGHGIGHNFFDLREQAARKHGASITAFCAVQRPETHAARPAEYRPLDGFWKKRGYTPRPDLICHYKWTDVGEREETDKPLMFWINTSAGQIPTPRR
tara:strand:- start:23760 stop:24374 length:615 start_codon:yes stop_codon:yes gene_type:complete